MRWANGFVEAEREKLDAGERIDRPKSLSIEDYIAGLEHYVEGSGPDDAVPAHMFWLVDDDEYIGRVSIRPQLTGWMERYGGHIGFEIRHSRRRRGYGTTALRLALDVASTLDLRRVLVTCDADNIGSRKIIERNGAEFESEVVDPSTGTAMRRYWIDTPER